MLKENKRILLFIVAAIICVVTVVIISSHNKAIKDATEEKEVANPVIAGLKIGVTDSSVYDYLRVLRGSTDNLYYLSEADTDKNDMSNLNVIVYTDGIGLDTWLDKLLANADRNDKRVIKLSSDIGIDYKDYSNISLNNAIQVVNYLAVELAQLDLDFSEFYNANAQSYIIELEQLKSKIQTVVDIGSTRELVFNTQEDLDEVQCLLDEFAIKGIVADKENKESNVSNVEFKKIHTEVNSNVAENESYLSLMEQNLKILNKALN